MIAIAAQVWFAGFALIGAFLFGAHIGQTSASPRVRASMISVALLWPAFLVFLLVSVIRGARW